MAKTRKKKMAFSQISIQQNLLGARFCYYVPAVLKHSDSPKLGWYIEYYATSSGKKALTRYRVKMNSIHAHTQSLKEFKMQANDIIQELNHNLHKGWIPTKTKVTYNNECALAYTREQMLVNEPLQQSATPSWVEDTVIPEYEPIQEIEMAAPTASADVTKSVPQIVPTPQMDNFGVTMTDLIDRCMAEKVKTIREATLRCYKSFSRELTTFVNEFYPGILANDFTRTHAQEFIDYKVKMMEEKKGDDAKYRVSERSINNLIKGMRLFFTWGIDNELVTDNPFAKIKLHRIQEKRRILVDENTLERIDTHLREQNQRGFLLVCMLVYNCFIRPHEIRQLKVENIDFNNHSIVVPNEVSKNHYSRVVGMTPVIEALMKELKITSLSKDTYIVGKGLMPNTKMSSDHDYRVAWAQLRDELDFPKEMQLYSLKDTGITTMLENGVPAIDVMKQAGHHDLSMTTRYANHADAKLASKMYKNAMKFGSQDDEQMNN